MRMNQRSELNKLHCAHGGNSSLKTTLIRGDKSGAKEHMETGTRELDKNLFSFQFFSNADKEYVLNKGPWAFDGHLLLVKEIIGLEQPLDIKFDTARFWMKAYSVPPKTNDGVRKDVGVQLGTFLGCDEANLYCGVDKSVNFQVEIDITMPLSSRHSHVRGKALWISLGYVKFPYFYYGCGKLGYVLKGNDVVVDTDLDVSKLRYGEWLRAPPKNRDASKAHLQLKFEDPGSQKWHQGLNGTGRKDMLVDEVRAIRVGNEEFKQKKHDTRVLAGKEREFYGTYVDARGRSGGLALLWLKDIQAKLLSQSLIMLTLKWLEEMTNQLVIYRCAWVARNIKSAQNL
ncbi:LOW QUALITY PROTEIN: hypothetical protein Cgig2_023644 [Carnegiea gigantea]|uniref:DUF4283 domain-containing protein n=1 Tax=Carnegiea gigantea TaxID=171969 RepID=A0A9Q1Q437_9CARY|nr:LOW QUALITY PROTEIN: hypothetical protein Cgig2_023644 [Carnegiea gigantea]